MKTLSRPQDAELVGLAPVQEIQLRPIFDKGQLVDENWWVEPVPATQGFFRRHWLFLVTVCAPVAFAALYYGLIAAGQYESEAQFLVRTAGQNDAANLASLMQTQKVSRAGDETFAVADYVVSRDAFRSLEAHNDLRAILSRQQADFLSRFPNFYSRDDFETLYRYFKNFIDVRVDTESGIATLKVRSFRPEDSRALASALLANAESLVNTLNARLFDDSLRMANKFVDEEKAKLIDVERRLTDFRNSENVIDPAKESAAALQELGKLMANLLVAETSLSQEIAEAPQSPHIPTLRETVAALTKQVQDQRGKISGASGSLANKLGEFDGLMLDRELAARGLAAAEARVITARQNVEQQQYYLQVVVDPNEPDVAAYPRRALSVLFVFGVSICVFGILRIALTNIYEHQR